MHKGVKQKLKVKILNNGFEPSNYIEPPLEIECPNEHGDIPLFEVLKKLFIPFNVIKKMIGK